MVDRPDLLDGRAWVARPAPVLGLATGLEPDCSMSGPVTTKSPLMYRRVSVDSRTGPAHARCAIGCHCKVKILDAGQMLEDILAVLVPHVDFMREIGFGLCSSSLPQSSSASRFTARRIWMSNRIVTKKRKPGCPGFQVDRTTAVSCCYKP